MDVGKRGQQPPDDCPRQHQEVQEQIAADQERNQGGADHAES